MSAPTIDWTAVINKFISAAQNVLYYIGDFLVSNAQAIATALLGVGLAVGLYTAFTRIPIVRSLVSRLF